MRSVKSMKFIVVLLALTMLIALIPASVFADTTQTVSLRRSGAYEAVQGDTVYLTITAKSNTADPYKLTLTTASGISIKSGLSGVISTTESSSVIYALEIASDANPVQRTLICQAVSTTDGKVLQEIEVPVTINKPESGYTSVTSAVATVNYSLSGGDKIVEGEVNTLNVEIFNKGNQRVNSAQVSLTLPDFLSIQSGAAAVYVGSFNPGKSVSASFPIIVNKSVESGSYPVKINISGTGYTVSETQHYDEGNNYTGSSFPTSGNSTSYSETVYIPVEGKGKKEEVDDSGITPILMVSSYAYGGENVTAGNEFDFSVTLQNTSNETLQNIKVTVDGGKTFIPVGTSASYYVASISPKSSNTHTLKMNCARDAEQGPVSVIVSSTYEDNDGAKLTSSDTLSVPVMQEVRFSIDDINDPGWFTADQECFAQVNYYNLGRNTLNNLRVSVEGDFMVDGQDSYYVGNMAPGKSDDYSVNFWPNGEGLCNGKFVFTFEDAAGVQHTEEKEFTFNIGPAYVWEEDPGDFPMEPVKQGLPKWAYFAIGGGALVLLLVVLKLIKRRKNKKQEALELDA